MILSIISPVYKAEAIVDELVRRIVDEISVLTNDFEIILVEDGSDDQSWDKIYSNCKRDTRIKGIKLSRNFGQHYAITAGVSKAMGEMIVIMDCDLQDDPKYIPMMYRKAKQGYEIVFTQRKDRKDGIIKSFNSWLFNKLFTILSDKAYDINTGSMVLFTQKVAKSFMKIKDTDRLYIQMLKWVGFNNVAISVEHSSRYSGESSYTFAKLLKMAVQGWTSHSTRLLRFSIYIGISMSFCSLLASIFVLIKYLLYDLQPGWPSIIIAIFFSAGLILMSIGIVGIYVGKTFQQAKDKPLFIISEELNINDEGDY